MKKLLAKNSYYVTVTALERFKDFASKGRIPQIHINIAKCLVQVLKVLSLECQYVSAFFGTS